IIWEGPALDAGDRFYLADVPGGSRIFAGISVHVPGTDHSEFLFYIHDAATGRRTAGPIRTENCLNEAYCSADGRRFLTTVGITRSVGMTRYLLSDLIIWDVATCREVASVHIPTR